MDELDKYHTVAKFVRMEHDQDTDSIYLVFKVTDERFKQKIQRDWEDDIPLKMINDRLVKFEE